MHLLHMTTVQNHVDQNIAAISKSLPVGRCILTETLEIPVSAISDH